MNHTKVYAIFMWLKNIKPYNDLYHLYVIKNKSYNGLYHLYVVKKIKPYKDVC